MVARKDFLTKEISSLTSQLSLLPPGKLICTHHKNHYKWYHNDGQTTTYIPKKNRYLAEQLALKRYLSLKLKDLQGEKCAIDFYLRHYKGSPSHAEDLLINSPEYRNLLQEQFLPLSEDLSTWMSAPYPTNPNYRDKRILQAISGNTVRSKSEVLIDMMLFTHQIPYRYECALTLGRTTLYPDFTIRHPVSGKTYYWEHFGQMDNPAYSKNVFSKLQLYNEHGIIPSIHLICTYETQQEPLSTSKIEKIITEYFL